MIIVERQVFDNGGYQIRMDNNKIIFDVCKDGRCFSKEKSIVEFYAWKLKRQCRLLIKEIDDLNRFLGEFK